MTTIDKDLRILITSSLDALVRDTYLKFPTDGKEMSDELVDKLLESNRLINTALNMLKATGSKPTTGLDYIECGGLQWALQNAGTDAENPNGKLYTFDEALTLENDLWRGPTRKEQEMFIDRTYHGFDKERKVMIFVDRKTGVMLEFPAVGRRNTDGSLNNHGTFGYYWSSTQCTNASGAYSMGFYSSGVVPSYNISKLLGFSVRLVRR